MNALALAFQAAMPLFPPPSPALFGPSLPFDPGDFDRHGPRDYQLDLLWAVVDAVRQGHRRILLQLPTGGGKTKIATALLASASWAQFIVHRKELIEQTSRSFLSAGVAHSFVAADKPYDPDAAVLLCGIVTLAERMGVVLPPDIVVWDEAHHLNAATWAEVMRAYPDALHIGLTATPQRLDGRGLGEHFETMVLGPSVRWLIDNAYLSDFDYYGPPPSGANESALLGDVVDHYLAHAAGQQGIVFASNRDHSKELAAEFVRRGVPALHVDGSMSARRRNEADRLFRSGDVLIETNVNLFGEGYDVPNIGYVGLARRTQSLSWFLQMVGRGLRPVYGGDFDLETLLGRRQAIVWGGKHKAVICDHGNNWFAHGMPDDERAWSLAGKLRGSGAGCNDDATPIHQCMNCYMITPSKERVCPGCGTAFPTVTRNIRFKEGTLTKIEREEARAQKEAEKKKAALIRKAEEREAKSERQLVELGERRDYPNPKGWAKSVLRRRAQWKGRG